MAVVQNTLIGKAKQSVGGTTFSSWKGINVLKSRPVSVANPQTDMQVARRNALTWIVGLYASMAVAVKKGWKKYAVKMSEYNAFTSDALKNAFDYAGAPVVTLDPGMLKLTAGTVTTGNENLAVQYDDPREAMISWTKTVAGNQALTDELQICLVSNDGSRVKAILIDKKMRNSPNFTLQCLPGETLNVGDVAIYGFTRADYSDASNGLSVAVTSV